MSIGCNSRSTSEHHKGEWEEYCTAKEDNQRQREDIGYITMIIGENGSYLGW